MQLGASPTVLNGVSLRGEDKNLHKFPMGAFGLLPRQGSCCSIDPHCLFGIASAGLLMHDALAATDLDLDALAARVDAVLNDELYWFPVRHHSAAVARHLEKVIAQRQPKVVFIEGPAEAQALIEFVVDADTKPPVAIYSSYRDDNNVLGLAGVASPAVDIAPRFACWYPLLAYSPEFIAMHAAKKINADVVFIDLPHYALIKPKSEQADEPAAEVVAAEEAEQKSEPYATTPHDDELITGSGFYQTLARVAGYRSWNEAWDSLFEIGEVTTDTERFRRELATFCAAARATTPASRIENDGTLERERHFMQTIRETLARRKLKATDALVVCGGFHLFLDRDDSTPPPSAPEGTVYATVVPYSFFRFSDLSGYGAGNRAPAFYQTNWDLMRADRESDVLPEHVVAILKRARKEGHATSSADGVSVTQHARMLAGLRGRPTPILDDIEDAIMTCSCKGDPADEGLALRRAIDATNIGTKVGKVTSKLGRLPIVHDFFAQLSDHDLGEVLGHERLVRFELDKRKPADERRSVLFHRLRFLEVPLAAMTAEPGAEASAGLLFRERWALKWNPKVETHLVEQTLLGDSIEAAVLSKLHEQFAVDSQHAGATCAHLRRALDMDLPHLVAEVQTACSSAVDADPQFVSLGTALGHLTVIDRYAVYRNLRRAELGELITRCFDRACFALPDVASAPQEQQAEIVSTLQALSEVVLKGDREDIDRNVFTTHLRMAADLSTVPYLRGAFLGLLAELREITPAELAAQVSAFAQSSPDQMVFAGDFLEGVLAVSRTSVMLGADSLVAAIDQLLRAAEWDVFLTMLPRLRAAIDRLHDRQVDSLAACVARKYGLMEDAQERLTELSTSVGAAALLADIDRRVAAIMQKWSF